MIKKCDKNLIIAIIILVLVNSCFLVYKKYDKIQINKISQNEKTNITLSRVNNEIVTQGSVVSYKIENIDNSYFDKKDIKVTVINSVNFEVCNAKVLEKDDSYNILVDTSLLPAGIYRVKIFNNTAFSGNRDSIGEVISKEFFKVILVEER